ncbi:MAG: hypothetical protein VB100_10255 [Angelakisella sp.]|nr:hypothetical protein [Angelakisella sp.]
MKLDLSRYAPPGINLRQEKSFFYTGIICAAIYSLGFIFRYSNARSNLYEWQAGKRVLISNAKIEDFTVLLDKALFGFLVLSMCMLALIAYHYAYYRQGSKSIYLMRRLPDGKLLHRQCISLPFAAVCICLISMALLFLVYFVIYMVFTPQACLDAEQWQKIWRVLQ